MYSKAIQAISILIALTCPTWAQSPDVTYLVDSAGKIIGPSSGSSVLLNIDGLAVAVPVPQDGPIRPYNFAVLYRQKDCKGPSYFVKPAYGTVGIPHKNKVYYGKPPYRKFAIASQKIVQPSMSIETAACEADNVDPPQTLVGDLAVAQPTNIFGTTPPYYLRFIEPIKR